PVGRSPSSIVATTVASNGSRREIVPSPLLATQTAPSPPIAIPEGCTPTCTVAVGLIEFGSKRQTSPCSSPGTISQTWLLPAAIAAAPGTGVDAVTAFVAGSIRDSRAALATQRAPSP